MEDLNTVENSVIHYILKHINVLSMNDKYTVARILTFRGYDLRQNNNGAYIDIYSVDSMTLRDFYQFMQSKLIAGRHERAFLMGAPPRI